MERNENEWNISNPIWKQHGENGMEKNEKNHFRIFFPSLIWEF